MGQPGPTPHEQTGGEPDFAGVPLPDNIKASNQQIGYLIDSAQFTLAEQFQVAERLDTKARNNAALTSAYFAAALAAALGVSARSSTTQALVIVICIVGVIAALVLLHALRRTSAALAVRSERFVQVATLQKYSSWAYEGHPLVGKNIADLTLKVADLRKQANSDRGDKVQTAERACVKSVWMTSALLIVLFISVALTS